MSREERVRAAQRAADAWVDRVWDSTTLRPLERLVALAYADWVGEDTASVWLHGPKLRQRTGLSRSGSNRALRGLEDAGWLTVTRAAAQHQSTRYALTLPPGVAQRSASRNAEQPSASRNAEASVLPDGTLRGSSVPPEDASVPPQDASVPPRGTDPSTYLSTHPPSRAGEASSAPPAVAGSGEGGGDDPRRVEAAGAARAAGIGEDVLDAFVDLALADPSTEHSVAGRIARDPAWRERHHRAARGQRAQARRSDDATGRAATILAALAAAGEPGRRALAVARADMGRPADDVSLRVLVEAERELRERLDAGPDAAAVPA